MDSKTIIKNNVRLLIFFEKRNIPIYYKPEGTARELDFHSDWNSLMSLVEGIEKLEINGYYIDFHIMPDAVIICSQEDENNPLVLINKSEGKGSIETEDFLFEDKKRAVYEACLRFTNWYETK